jgi:formylglycine-generating enzyme required for sulfatase activity
MAVNPVMLTAIAALHWNRTRLPDQRTELYDSVLAWLSQAREEQRKELREEASGRMPAVQCLKLMEDLAYAMHKDERGKQTEITRHRAAWVLAPRFRDVADDEKAAAAERFLVEEEIDSGILVSRGDTLRFWHLTFQEYLAAKALAWRDADRWNLLFEQNKLYLPDWRETVLLLAGVLCKQDPVRVDELLKHMLGGLGANASLAERARCVGLIGRILRDLKSWKYTIADAHYRENLDRVLAIFDTCTARQLDFTTRLEAADALGQAGDPRLEQDNWLKVEGGTFWMGAQKTDPGGRNYDKEAHDDEAPVHQVEVGTFRLARYPVTVFEYGRFMETGGYRQEQFWKEGGGYGEYTEPGHWQRQLAFPNRPVVEVSWHEAAAYCRWAGGRLPTEAEWECAARGGRESVRYPWGNEKPDHSRANFEAKPGHPTPVGLYPAGATPGGIHDLAGNVYEWVSDWWGDYAEAAAKNPRGPKQGEGKPVRGGAWYVNAWGLRASSRDGYHPGNRYNNLGFRCSRELISL